MKTAFATAALVLAAASTATAQPPQAAGPADRAQMILSALVEVSGVPGMGAAVWKDGRILWSGSAGYADVEAGRRVDDETVFRMASVSKLFAVSAVGRLVEQGRMDLDTPVRSTLPWLDNDWPAITPRQLAAHTSGMPHYQTQDEARGGVRYATVREAVGLFQNRPLLTPPGQAYKYSSWGYTLLSAVVEAATDRPYLDYVAGEITPGLTIVPDATDGPDPHASVAYEFVNGVARRAAPHDFSYTWAGGGMGATLPALATWGGRVLDGEVMSHDTFDSLLVPTRLNDGTEAAESGYTVGVGWRASSDQDGRRLAHHAGVALGARSSLVLYRDQRAAAAIASNALWVSSIDISAQMVAAPFLPIPRNALAIPCPTGATVYRGTYGDAAVEGTARFEVENGICVGELGVAPGNAFGDAANGLLQGDTAALKVIGVEADDGLGRAALVTPMGVYDLRGGGDGGWSSPLGGSRPLSIRLD